MPATPRPHNAGPSAAPKNRAAILSAARTLFAQQGYHVPLNAIARAAGVGQGVLYRHFPHRIDLALAVFDDNFAELEAIAAAQSGQDCFGVLCGQSGAGKTGRQRPHQGGARRERRAKGPRHKAEKSASPPHTPPSPAEPRTG